MGYRQLVHTTAYIIAEIAAKVESAFKKKKRRKKLHIWGEWSGGRPEFNRRRSYEINIGCFSRCLITSIVHATAYGIISCKSPPSP